MMRYCLVAAMVLCLSLAGAGLTAGQLHADNSTASAVTVETLAQGPVKNLPAGGIFISILESRQLPGADFGPHSHIPAIIYTRQGISAISLPGAATRSVGPGEAAFIPALAVHTHQNPEGRIGAGAVAVGLVVVVILLCAATWLRGGRRRVVIAVLLLLLIAGGTLPLIGATTNDYYLIAVRPDAQRGLPMPRPDGRNIYASPDMDPMPAAPYIETLSAITVPPGARYDAPDLPGPVMIIGAKGTASVQIGNETTQLSDVVAAFAQTGQTLAIVNSGSDTLKVLDFAVTSALPAAPSAVSAMAGPDSATVSWTAPSSNGGPITGYTVTWSGGNQSCSGSPCLVSGLTAGTAYTFTVTATNAGGTGPASAPSKSVTPTPPLAGGPVPAQLIGDWFLFLPAVVTAVGGAPCPSPPTHTNCFFQLTLTATTYIGAVTALGGSQPYGSGDVVVNHTEIDFFNGGGCGLQLPDGVGRYKWALQVDAHWRGPSLHATEPGSMPPHPSPAQP
jgi:Fibronectin type III domain